MADSAIQVSVKADVTDLKAKLAVANAELKSHQAELRNTAKAAAQVGADMRSSFMPAVNEAAAAAARSSTEVAKLKEELSKAGDAKGLLGTFDALKGRFASMASMGGEIREFAEAFMAAFAVEKISEWVGEITEAGAKVEHLSQQLGMPAETISKLGFAMKAMGMSVDDAATMLEKLERNMVKAASGEGGAAKAFQDLGISAADLKNADPSEVLNKIADAFAGAADGPAKTAIAMELLGRSGAQMIPVLNEGSAGLKELGATAEQTGSVITGSMAEGMERTAVNTATMKASFDGLTYTLYNAFHPAIDAVINDLTGVIQELTAMFKEVGVGHDVLTALVVIIDAVVEAFDFWTTAIGLSLQSTELFVTHMAGDFTTLGIVIKDALTGHWSEISADYAAGMANVQAQTETRLASMSADFQAWATRTKALLANVGSTGVDTSGGPDKEEKPKPQLDAKNLEDGSGDKSQVEAWEAQLKAMLLQQQKFGADAQAEEVSFWKAKLATVTGAGATEQAERAAINDKLYSLEESLHSKEVSGAKKASDAEAAAARKAAAERQEIARDDLATNLDIQKMRLEAQKDSLQAEVDAGKITNQQKVADEIDLANKIYQIDLQLLQQQLNIDGQTLVERNRINDQILKLEAQHQLDMAKLQTDAAAATKADLDKSVKDWDTRLEPINRAFDGMVSGMLQGTLTLQQGIARLAQSMVIAFAEAEAKALVHWVATELAKTSATAAGTAARIGLANAEQIPFLGFIVRQIAQWLGMETTKTVASTTGTGTRIAEDAAYSASSLALTKSTATQNAASWAAAYAAAAMSSAAAIPVVGWAMAPGVGAAAYATGMSFAALASAEKGWDRVPQDGMLTELHKDEMVLPSELADSVRSLPTSWAMRSAGATDFSGMRSSAANSNSTVNHTYGPTNVHVHPSSGMSEDQLVRKVMRAAQNRSRNMAGPTMKIA